MAWHSGKPADTDLLSQSVQYIRENFAELEPLQPYVAAIVDSRIVDHNLDVPTSPNGRYVRWENGLQVCFVRSVGAGPSPVDWVLPAAFVDGSYAVVGTSLDWPFLVVTVDWQYTTANNVRFRKWDHDGTEFTGALRAISAFAIGRWK